jgi:hypothetical protein
MPALSPTMTHGNVGKWILKEGDKARVMHWAFSYLCNTYA